MARNKFQKQLDRRGDSNDRAARALLAKIERLPEERRRRVWTIDVKTSDFYRDMSRKATFVKMYVTDRQVKWLEDILKQLKEVRV